MNAAATSAAPPSCEPCGSPAAPCATCGSQAPSIRWSGDVGTDNSAMLRQELRDRMARDRRPIQFVSATSDVGLRAERVTLPCAELGRALHIEPLRDRLVRTLSSGERQRVRLAAALVAGASDIALDEAVRHLDPFAVVTLARLLESRRTEGTSLLVCDIRRSLPSSLFDRDDEAVEPLALLDKAPAVESEPIDMAVPSRFVPGARRSEGRVVSLPKGALTWLSGPNGAGKTSLLAAMLLSARSQRIQAGFARQDVELQVFAPTPRAELRDVARSWRPAAWLRSILPEYAEAPEAPEALETCLASLVGLDPWLDAPMRALPLGALALLGSAIALLMGRDLVLLDEPTQGLDERAAHRLATALLQSARAGARIVVASHDPLVSSIASGHWCVDAGELVSTYVCPQPCREAS